jgi:hypothetical protein
VSVKDAFEKSHTGEYGIFHTTSAPYTGVIIQSNLNDNPETHFKKDTHATDTPVICQLTGSDNLFYT